MIKLVVSLDNFNCEAYYENDMNYTRYDVWKFAVYHLLSWDCEVEWVHNVSIIDNDNVKVVVLIDSDYCDVFIDLLNFHGFEKVEVLEYEEEK